ncbi:MAG: glycosyltransferase [Deltaproteobacteria bacterium]
MTAPAQAKPVLRELVVCSLEPWDEVWRRNQLLVSQLLEIEQHLRVLFVGPAVDATYELVAHHTLRHGRGLTLPPGAASHGRLSTYGPTKWVPRTAGTVADRLLVRAVERAARAVGFEQPLLWINDLALAPLATRTGWPTLYDVTDDWLLASCTERERLRRIRDEATLIARAREVVVCSPALVKSKGRYRPVTLITNAVDVDWIRMPTTRPPDMPLGPVACYVGTLHEDRLDVGLCVELAARLEGKGALLLVGPGELGLESRRQLAGKANVVLLGARPHDAIPGYLQHADVLVVPHRRTPFTESLDPIKAYEYRAVGRPIVATPVAGFRGLGDPVQVAAGSGFLDATLNAVIGGPRPPELLPCPVDLPTWESQARRMRDVLIQLAIP